MQHPFVLSRNLPAASLLVCLVAASPSINTPSARAGDVSSEDGGRVQIKPGLVMTRAQTGSISYDEDGATFTPRTRFDRRAHRTYGWSIQLEGATSEIDIVEILTLPVAPTHWGVMDHTAVSDDRRCATTTRAQHVDATGGISNFWVFSEGDPQGTYVIEVWIEGVFVKRFRVEVD